MEGKIEIGRIALPVFHGRSWKCGVSCSCDGVRTTAGSVVIKAPHCYFSYSFHLSWKWLWRLVFLSLDSLPWLHSCTVSPVARAVWLLDPTSGVENFSLCLQKYNLIIFSRNYFNLGYLIWIKLPWGKWDQNKSQTRINLYEDQVLSFNMISWVYFNFCCNQSVNVSLTHTPCHALSALCIAAFCPTLLHLPLWLVKCF